MTVAQLVEKFGLEVLTGAVGMEREVKKGYTSDLLSDVIANIEEGSIWITVQRHINILGVAKLKDVPAIIIPRHLDVEEAVIEKAQQENIAILRCPQTAFEISGLLYGVLAKG